MKKGWWSNPKYYCPEPSQDKPSDAEYSGLEPPKYRRTKFRKSKKTVAEPPKHEKVPFRWREEAVYESPKTEKTTREDLDAEFEGRWKNYQRAKSPKQAKVPLALRLKPELDYLRGFLDELPGAILILLGIALFVFILLAVEYMQYGFVSGDDTYDRMINE